MKKNRIIAIALALLVLMTLAPSQNVEAASKKTKALKAYGKFLKKHPSQVLDFGVNYHDAGFTPEDLSYVDAYSIKDLNKDNVPELITDTYVNFRWTITRIYTWKNNKVVPYKNVDGRDAVFNNCSVADGWDYFYFCKKGHLHNDHTGSFSSEFNTYKLTKKGIKSYLIYSEDYMYETKSITKDGKNISEKTYNKLVKGCKATKTKIYKNNKKNQKLLKKGKVGRILFDFRELDF